MSDTPCVDGCGQDAATIERLRAERDRIAADRRDLVATLARVEALAGKWSAPNFASFLTGVQAAGALREALNTPLAPADASQVPQGGPGATDTGGGL